jgi:PAP2 superfamily
MALTTDVARPRVLSHVGWVLGQVLAVAVGIFVYFRIRGLAHASVDVAMGHAHNVSTLERWLGIDMEHAVQAPVAASQTLATAANWVYVWGHWPVILTTMVWLMWRHRDVFRRLRDAMLVSGFLGMAIFVSFPVAPPRLADPSLVDTVTESSEAYRYLQPPAFVNQYAAMPSLHAGWDLLVGLAIISAAASVAVKAAGVLMPLLMMWAVVATANHYVLDVVAGIALVLIGHVAALLLERRRAQSRTGVHAEPQ